MRLLICAGGTGGGVYPALAVLDALKSSEFHADKQPHPTGFDDLDVLWVGGVGGMEVDLVKRQGIPYISIPAAGIHGVGWRALPGNIMKLIRGLMAARGILERFHPQVLFFTGGYVAIPMAVAGHLPVRGRAKPNKMLYVPDIEPGLALRTLSRFADRIAVTNENSKKYFPHHSSVVVTGYPVRTELGKWVRSSAREYFNLSEERSVIFVYGGSKGARSINQALLAILPELLERVQVLHVSGMTDWAEVETNQTHLIETLPKELTDRYHAFPYLYTEMGAALAATDLVISRSGASVLGELPYFGVPAILIPYPHAWRYQQVNARYLQDRGAAVILQDDALQPGLLPLVCSLIDDRERLQKMRDAMLTLAGKDAASRIAEEIRSLAQPSGGSI